VGKVVITGGIRLVTGLHIGGAAAGLDIGGVDNPIIRHPATREPYIPGSSLRGKMRSLLERAYDLPLNKKVQDVRLHECYNEREYRQCAVCHVFGVSPGERERGAPQGEQADRRGEWESFKPTRLIVRDVAMHADSKAELETADTDLPYTEVKWEASIDRITSAAVPRQNERVPAGTRFEPFEMVYTIYRLKGDDWQQDVEWLKVLFEGMRLLEDDYLGGYGSRGAGKIVFENLTVELRPLTYYTKGQPAEELDSALDLRDDRRVKALVDQIKQALQGVQ
ncbi:MAG: type III-A CRISPR-associated RAMP protein Csm3, partial [Fimbriimonadales bacterium]|nr:type III-A CRISPR-associated RAMP protein Csm3 [Fimbriimonadales bacterium]